MGFALSRPTEPSLVKWPSTSCTPRDKLHPHQGLLGSSPGLLKPAVDADDVFALYLHLLVGTLSQLPLHVVSIRFSSPLILFSVLL